MNRISTKKLVLTAIFMALTTISTMFIRIPLPLGYVNLGDAFVLLSVFVLGPICGTITAGIGSAFADLLGYITYAPGTLIIKALMALTAYFTYKLVLKISKITILSQIIAGVVATLIMAFGYFVYETIFFTTATIAIVSLPFNLLQGAVGTAVAVIVAKILSTTKLIDKLR